MAEASVVCRYVDGSHGQLHLREINAGMTGVPLICLHATAYSSRSFIALMRAFEGRRHVIAIDLPGYGESARPAQQLDMAGYAQAISPGLGRGQVDLFGYHTGVAVAAELAIARPKQVRQMVWMGVPYFQAMDFDHWRKRLATPHHLGADLDQFSERWDFLVRNRPEGLSLDRGFENFVDELKAWPHGSEAHQALFSYDFDARLAKIACPVTIFNPDGHLAEASRAAARKLPLATLVELQGLHGAVLDRDAAVLADLIRPA